MHTPRMQTSLYADPLYADPWMQPPDADPTGCVTCDACWEATPPTEWLKDASENINFPCGR